QLTHDQNNFNQYLLTICVQLEHAFSASKGHFQSPWELCHPIANEKELQYVIHWANCCLISHNMII
ncbi:hypothetical protein PAXRUDRAFT_180258, partial [Paxillus rubicundulus Ve08.2h10]